MHLTLYEPNAVFSQFLESASMVFFPFFPCFLFLIFFVFYFIFLVFFAFFSSSFFVFPSDLSLMCVCVA